MKKILFGLGLFGLGLAVGVAATSPLDPLRAAPHIYELAFENDRVRVLKRLVRSGETAPLISQPDRVVVYLNPCEPTWQPANTHGGNTANVIEECHIVEVELK
jgi:hypothetical protein